VDTRPTSQAQQLHHDRAQTPLSAEEFQEWLRTGIPRIGAATAPAEDHPGSFLCGNHAMHIAALEDSNRPGFAQQLRSAVETAHRRAARPFERRPIQNFTDILTESNAGFLTYNSLQTKLERPLRRWFFLINSFTWSRGINNSSADLEAKTGTERWSTLPILPETVVHRDTTSL